jgi:hypothetical protein
MVPENNLFTPHPDPLLSRGEGIVKNLGKVTGKRSSITGTWSRIGGILFVAVVFLWLQPVKLWQENLHPQTNREEIKPLVDFLQTHRQPGDFIYVYYFAIDPFKFYYQGPQDKILWGKSCHDRCLPLLPEEVQQVERLWMIFSHIESDAEVDGFIANLLGPGWTRHLELSQPGAKLFCYRPPWSRSDTGPEISNPPGP